MSEKKRANPPANSQARYKSSIFQFSKSFLSTETGFVEDDIRLVLDDYNSKNYEIYHS